MTNPHDDCWPKEQRDAWQAISNSAHHAAAQQYEKKIAELLQRIEALNAEFDAGMKRNKELEARLAEAEEFLASANSLLKTNKIDHLWLTNKIDAYFERQERRKGGE